MTKAQTNSKMNDKPSPGFMGRYLPTIDRYYRRFPFLRVSTTGYLFTSACVASTVLFLSRRYRLDDDFALLAAITVPIAGGTSILAFLGLLWVGDRFIKLTRKRDATLAAPSGERINHADDSAAAWMEHWLFNFGAETLWNDLHVVMETGAADVDAITRIKRAPRKLSGYAFAAAFVSVFLWPFLVHIVAFLFYLFVPKSNQPSFSLSWEIIVLGGLNVLAIQASLDAHLWVRLKGYVRVFLMDAADIDEPLDERLFLVNRLATLAPAIFAWIAVGLASTLVRDRPIPAIMVLGLVLGLLTMVNHRNSQFQELYQALGDGTPEQLANVVKLRKLSKTWRQIYHDLINPLAAIETCLDTLVHGMPDDVNVAGPLVKDLAAEALIVTIDCKSRLADGRTMQRGEALPHDPVPDVRAVVWRAIDLGRRRYPKVACGLSDVPSDPIRSPVSKRALVRVLENLVLNALEAASRDAGTKKVAVTLHSEMGRVQISLRNNGRISEEVCNQLEAGAERVRSSKGKDGGSGLAYVRDEMLKLKGSFQISPQGSETIATVELPGGE